MLGGFRYLPIPISSQGASLRKITRDAATAFVQGKRFKRGNTAVEPYAIKLQGYTFKNRGCRLTLHGHTIADWMPLSETALLSMCGWGTPTTRERINGLLEVLGIPARLHQQDHEQYVYVQGESVPIDASAEFFFTKSGHLEVL
jgi:hypothetical protein